MELPDGLLAYFDFHILFNLRKKSCSSLLSLKYYYDQKSGMAACQRDCYVYLSVGYVPKHLEKYRSYIVKSKT